MLDFLVKTASVLRSVGSPAARQAAEAIDGVIMAEAARAGVMTVDEVKAFHDKLDAFLNDVLGGKVPRGFKRQLVMLRGGQKALVKRLARMTKATDVLPADEDGREPQFDIDVVEPEPEFDVDVAPRISVKPVDTSPQGTRSEYANLPSEPQGTAAEPGMLDKVKDKVKGLFGIASLAESLLKVADRLDQNGDAEAAEIIERIVATAARDYPGLNETRKELYDFDGHNKELVGDLEPLEVPEERREHHLETHRGTAASQTRYSPDLPGVMMERLEDGRYRDIVTGKVYDFHEGFVDGQGVARSGGSVALQTPLHSHIRPPARLFEGLSRKR